TATADKIIISLDALKKKSEAIIVIINQFVQKYYRTEREEREKMKMSLGKEIEKIRKSAKENGLDLSTPLNDWHTLNRNVDCELANMRNNNEASLLTQSPKAEANRMLKNYEVELDSLSLLLSTTTKPSYFIHLKYLDTQYQYANALALLKNVATAGPPIKNHREHTRYAKKNVILMPTSIEEIEYRSNDSGWTDLPVEENEQDFLLQGVEENPDREILLSLEDVFDFEYITYTVFFS
ncbi:hypothetical protein, partial, partial [Parasitella parasitica]